jgi:hypothetical protein
MRPRIQQRIRPEVVAPQDNQKQQNVEVEDIFLNNLQ